MPSYAIAHNSLIISSTLYDQSHNVTPNEIKRYDLKKVKKCQF